MALKNKLRFSRSSCFLICFLLISVELPGLNAYISSVWSPVRSIALKPSSVPKLCMATFTFLRGCSVVNRAKDFSRSLSPWDPDPKKIRISFHISRIRSLLPRTENVYSPLLFCMYTVVSKVILFDCKQFNFYENISTIFSLWRLFWNP